MAASLQPYPRIEVVRAGVAREQWRRHTAAGLWAVRWNRPLPELKPRALPFHLVVCHLQGDATETIGGRRKRPAEAVDRVTVIPAFSRPAWPSARREPLLQFGIAPGVLTKVARDEHGLGYEELALEGSSDRTDDAVMGLAQAALANSCEAFASSRRYRDGLFSMLLSHLVRRYGVARAPESEAPWNEEQLQRFTRVVETRIDAPLSLGSLADELGLDRFALIRACKATLGVTPYQYVLSRRVERALQLLTDGHLSIAEVALASGFSSQSHLTDVLRRRMGTTPAHFRRRNANPRAQ